MDDQALELWWPPKRRRGQCSSFAATDYDVFLNHRGPDVKTGFIAHLDEALRAAGLNPFLDKESLRKGDPASTSIDAALKVAKVHVAVVSKGYAESKYCLSELVAMLRSGKPVIPVYYEVEPEQLRWEKNGPFAAAFEKHKRKRPPEQVQEWTHALRHLADITGFCFRSSDYSGDEAQLKREVVDAVLGKLTPTFEVDRRMVGVQKHVNTCVIDRRMVGVQKHVNTCVKKLEEMSSSTCILGLVGMGGVGKTSLAEVLYSHFLGQRKFQATSFLAIDRNTFWRVEVGPSLLARLQKQLLWDLLHVPSNIDNLRYSDWFHMLSEKGPVLIVLDGIREASQFDELISDTSLLAKGSCIIVTSCYQHLLKIIGGESNFYIHEVTPLGIDDAQKLFNFHAFHNEDALQNFKARAKEVTNACGGLPLALEVVGSSLYDEGFSEDLECIWPEAKAALKNWKLRHALDWSYNHLLGEEKRMFLDIACVLHGWKKEAAMAIWESCKNCSSCSGYDTPNCTLRSLIDKSLVVIDNSQGFDVLAMHGLLQDMGQRIGVSNGSYLSGDKATKALEDGYKGQNKVRVLNLANSGKRKFKYEDFEKMTNLHYLILDGCDVSGNIGCVSRELRSLQWRNMPLIHVPSMREFSNLVSLDFSCSNILANAWMEANPA